MPSRSARPRFLNLFQIRQPITALVSITHRISGVLLFLSLPFAVGLLHLSLRSAGDYQRVLHWLALPGMKLLGLLLGWAILHHFFAGLRFLLLDLDLGLRLQTARATAWSVFAIVAVFFLLLTWRLA